MGLSGSGMRKPVRCSEWLKGHSQQCQLFGLVARQVPMTRLGDRLIEPSGFGMYCPTGRNEFSKATPSLCTRSPRFSFDGKLLSLKGGRGPALEQLRFVETVAILNDPVDNDTKY